MKTLQTKKAIYPLQGEIYIPPDKSMSHRAVIMSALHKGETLLQTLLEGEDIMATINAFCNMGVTIEQSPTHKYLPNHENIWLIKGVGLDGLRKPEEVLDMGNSGTSTRLILGILAGQNFETVIDGDESLRKRPMKRVTDPLSQMGAKFEFLEKDGCLPIKVIGNPNLKPLKNYELPVASAQIKSAILFAGLYANGETSIIEKKPSRNHTENIFRYFRVNIKISGNEVKLYSKKERFENVKHVGISYLEASDPSSCAFFITAGLLAKDSKIIIPNMSLNETRTGFWDVVKKIMSCNVVLKKFPPEEQHPEAYEPYAKEVIASYSKITGEHVIPPEYAPRMIDEYPILAVLAAGSEATIRMEGIGELRVKESDRIAVMQKGLEACGVKVESGEDWMTVYGTGKVKGGATIETHLDHRIAMSFIILGLIAEEPITIDDISPIQTSFPNFFTELKKLGVDYGI